MLPCVVRWLVCDSTYNDEARWCGHLDSYSHWLRAAGEEVSECDMRVSMPPHLRDIDVVFALDRWLDLADYPARCRIAQVGAEIPPLPWQHRGYHGIVSSLWWMVDVARTAGVNAERIPLAFDPRALAAGAGVARDINVLFAGSLVPGIHDARIRALDELRAQITAAGWPDIVIKRGLFGRAYFAALAAARVVVNPHADWARGETKQNMRHYEALGMGSAVVDRPGQTGWCAAIMCAREADPARFLATETYEQRIPQLIDFARRCMP